MGLRALNNPKSSFEDPYASTGTGAVGKAPETGPLSATGGTKYTYSGKVIHKFTADGNLVITSGGGTCEVIVVAGGGGGGAYRGAGGGAGGVAIAPAMPFQPGTHTVVVGAKGNKGTAPGSATDVDGTNGGDSTVTNGTNVLTGKGGGYGGGGNHSGNPGGSGGGGTWPVGQSEGDATQPTQNSFPFPVTNYGYAGGDSSAGPPKYGSGGGGGAAGAGLVGHPTYGGNGALGIQLPTTYQDPTNPVGYPGPGETTFWVAGGGGGGAIFSPVPLRGIGGSGAPTSGPFCGAGDGGHNSGDAGADASVNSGSGGGGSVCIGDPYGDQRSGGDGGSGLVLISYPE